MKHPKANMWRSQAALDQRPALRQPRPYVFPGTPKADPSIAVATNIAEPRFGSRADKLLRRFSWEDDGE